MRRVRWCGWMVAAAACLLVLEPASGGLGSTAVPPPPAEEQPEVLTRGPVHEAFAEPVILRQESSLVAPRHAPADIDEEPPYERPHDSGAVWVPGYWSWDADRSDFIWVSGCWRIAPPNTYWVPGYWTPVTDGWQWVAGFWAPTSDQEIEYLPPPPIADLEPTGAPPVADAIWVPPCYYWQQEQYILRRGYWLRPQPNWVWVPSHYVWTPRGYIFAAGHWDYILDRRGVLFAPVYFPRALASRPRYPFSPSITVDLGTLRVNLFAYPRYRHFLFGDYYDDAYIRIGIYPRFDCERVKTWYDPIYVHDRWTHKRTEPRWEEQVRREYVLRRDDKDQRPPRTYREMESRLGRAPESRRQDLRAARPLRSLVTEKTVPFTFERMDTATRRRITERAHEVRRFVAERHRWEAEAAPPRTTPPTADRREPVRPPNDVRGPRERGPERPSAAPGVRVTRPERVKVPSNFRTQRSGPPRPEDEDRDRERDTPDRGRDSGQRRAGRRGD